MQSFGRYELYEQLGQGGMGVVFRAHDTVLQRIVALKLVGVSYADDPEMRERFFREARAAAQLTHKNIVTVYDLGEHEGRPYLAMEYLAGEDLQRRLAHHDKMPVMRRLEIAIEICHGVEHAHAHGIVHRDLKPANIYLAENAGVKILDFGLARPMASQLTHSNMLMGTLNYMAPEQVRAERADQRSDIFSLGVVLYELFGGRKAFDGDSVASTLYKILEEVPEPLPNLDPELPPALWPIVERALAKNREDRYQQVSALAGDLHEIVHPPSVSVVSSQVSAAPVSRVGSNPPVSMESAPTVPPSAPPAMTTAPPGSAAPGRRIAGAAGLVAAVAIVAAGTAWFVVHRSRPSTPESTQSAVTSSVPASQQSPPAGQTPPSASPSTPTPAPAETAPAAADGKVVTPAEGAAIAARQQSDAARGRMAESRAAAQAAGAPEHAATAFRNAERRAQDGDRLVRARKYDDAAAKYYEASGLFRDAEAAARSATAAPSAPAPVESTQQKPPQQGAGAPLPGTAQATPLPLPPTPPAPVTQPQTAPAPAVTPSRSSSPPPAAPQGPSDDERVAELINRYREALEARNLDRLKQLWPSLGGAAEVAIRDEFQHANRISVQISSPQIALNGGSGRVTFVRNYSLVTVDGQRLQSSSNVTMDVRRAGAGWVIESVRFSPR
jgi:serine/threonine-protein kinase